MNTRITHPIWAHLPALVALVALFASLLAAGPLPAEAAVHFFRGGAPNAYGSPWTVFGVAIGLSVFYILLSVLLDELWARQETAKTFNWLSLFDEALVGGLTGMSLGYLKFLKAGGQTLTFPWTEALLVGGGAVALGIVLEALRPFKAHPPQLVGEDISGFQAELKKRLEAGVAFVYWEAQNPWYVTVLATLVPVVMFVRAAFIWFSQPLVAVMLLALGVVFLLFNGGQRTIVTRQDVYIRYGLPGIKVLHLKTAGIAASEPHSFAPLKDFGGYGIRINREMKAYYLNGTRGVKVTTASGKKYLIGSDHPERLAAVLRAVGGQCGQKT